MCAAVCGMIALLHLLVCLKQPPGRIYLVSSLMAIAAALNAMAELALLNSSSIDDYVRILKFENLVVAVLLISMVWLVELHLGTARRWLAVSITVLWLLALIANFSSPYSLVFSEITELLSQTTFWGESYSVAIGTTNNWKWLADATIVLILIYVLDASVRSWRQGDRDRGLVVGGSIMLFIIAAGIHTPLVDAGIIATPYMVSFAFLAIVIALSYNLVHEVVKVRHYTRELERSNRELDRIMRSNVLGELSSSLAHELNQPLAAILSNAQAAQRFVADENFDITELREILSDIVYDDKRASEVILRMRRMLDRGEVPSERFSINGAVDDAIRLVRRELSENRIDLHLCRTDTLPPVHAGKIEIQQVILNLILNAVQAMESSCTGDAAIRITTALEGGCIKVSIEDSGPGLTEKQISRAFEPFYSTRTEGMGMGLAICRRIIVNYGGRIGVANRTGGGAGFWFTLPCSNRS